MSVNCPHCGAHLTVTLTAASKATSAAAAAQRRKTQRRYTLVPAKKPYLLDLNPTDADLRRLQQLMCFPFKTVQWKPTQPTMRPVVSDKEDEVGLLKDGRACETLDRVARKMHATVRACGEQSADTLLESRKRSRTEHDLKAPMHAVIEAVGAMIYAMEWASGQPGEKELVTTAAGAVLCPLKP